MEARIVEGIAPRSTPRCRTRTANKARLVMFSFSFNPVMATVFASMKRSMVPTCCGDGADTPPGFPESAPVLRPRAERKVGMGAASSSGGGVLASAEAFFSEQEGHCIRLMAFCALLLSAAVSSQLAQGTT